MDGLSGAASGMAVVSLALQLVGSIKQLHDFWDSVKEAPDDVHTITVDLSLLSSVLAEMAFEEQHFGPDQTLTTALGLCCDKVNKLIHITSDMEPGFASKRLRTRKWTALKAVLKGESIQKLQKVLESLKATLMLAQQNHLSRLNRVRYQSQQQDFMRITRHLSSLKLEQMSASITTISNSLSIANDHTDSLRRESLRICQSIQNPTQRIGFELGSDIAIQDLASNLSKDQSIASRPLAIPEIDEPALMYRYEKPRPSRQQTMTEDTLNLRNSVTQTFFGAIKTTFRTRLSRSRFVNDEALDDDECQYEHDSSFSILPAQWLLKLGFNYAYRFSTYNSSTQGWQFCIKPINLVPDDASIFRFCVEGNVEEVRDLISRNLASFRDVDSEGRTALHWAVRSHNPELCRFLIEAGADKNAGTFFWSQESPLQEIYRRPITEEGLVNAIDTCRIFEDTFDFGDKQGEGWEVLKRAPVHFRYSSAANVEAALKFFLWLIQSSSPDIKASYNSETVFDIVTNSYPGMADAVGLLLKLGPPGTIDSLCDSDCSVVDTFSGEMKGAPLFYFVAHRCWDSVQTMLMLGANPHPVHLNDWYSPVAEWALSLAMYSSWAFWAFRNALQGISLPFERILHEELKEGRPLLAAGWDMMTLRAMLETDFKPDNEPPKCWEENLICDSCNCMIYCVEVQPYWQCMLENFKNGTYQQMSCSDTPHKEFPSIQSHVTVSGKDYLTNTADEKASEHDTALSEDQAAQPDEEFFISENGTSSAIPDRKEIWCIWCWYDFKETGERDWHDTSDGDDVSEDGFSPFLINT